MAFNPLQLSPDITTFLLPFIFTFAIVYGLLVKADIFGKANDRISIVLALVIGIFVAGVLGRQMAEFLVRLFGGATIFLAGILVVLLFFGMIKYEMGGKAKSIAVYIVVIIGVLLFLAAQGSIGGIRLDSNTASLIFWAVVVLAVIYFVANGGYSKPASGPAEKPKE